MSRWVPDPVVLAALNGRQPLTYTILNRLFGTDSVATIGDAPYSIQRMFYPPGDGGIGLTEDNLERGEMFLDADLEISPSAALSQSDVAGVMSGVIDVTAYGAVGDGVTNDYDSIRDAIVAARDSSGTSRSTVVWFPRRHYICNPTGANPHLRPSIEIFPGLTYWGAPGCIVERTDAANASAETPVFGTLTTWSADSSAAAFVRGFIIDGDGKGHTGVYVSGGAFVLIEQCIVQYCYIDSASYSNRAGVSVDSCDLAIVEDCIFNANAIGVYFSECSGAIQRNFVGFDDDFASAWTNIGQRGNIRVFGSGPRGLLVAQNAVTGANRAVSGSARNAAILSEVDGATISNNAIHSFRRAGTSGIALGDSGGIYAGVYNIASRNKVFSTSKSQSALALGAGIVAERNERNIAVGNQVFAQSEGKTTFAHGIKTTPASGITTYGKNVIASNQVGKGVTAAYALNSPTPATDYDIDRSDPAPVNVAWCRLSEAMDPEKRPRLVWRPVGEGLFFASGTSPKQVSAMRRFQQEVVIGGGFNLTGPRDCDGLARFSPDRLNQMAAMGSSSTRRVEGLAEIRKKLYIGGSFTTVNGATLRYAAKTDALQTAPSDLGGGISSGTSVYAFGEAEGGVIVAGEFTQVTKVDASTLTAGNFAIYDDDDDDWQSGWTTASFNGRVRCAKRIGDQVWLGGDFTSVTSKGGVTAGARRVARIKADLSDGPFNLDLSGTSTSIYGVDGNVWAIEDAGGLLLLGGEFTNGLGPIGEARYLALFKAGSGVVSMLDADIQAPASVRTIQGVGSGRVSLLGGKAYLVGGAYFIGVLEIQANLDEGSTFSTLPTTGIQSLSSVSAIYADEENDLLFIGGNFYPNANALFADANQTNQ